LFLTQQAPLQQLIGAWQLTVIFIIAARHVSTCLDMSGPTLVKELPDGVYTRGGTRGWERRFRDDAIGSGCRYQLRRPHDSSAESGGGEPTSGAAWRPPTCTNSMSGRPKYVNKATRSSDNNTRRGTAFHLNIHIQDCLRKLEYCDEVLYFPPGFFPFFPLKGYLGVFPGPM